MIELSPSQPLKLLIVTPLLAPMSKDRHSILKLSSFWILPLIYPALNPCILLISFTNPICLIHIYHFTISALFQYQTHYLLCLSIYINITTIKTSLTIFYNLLIGIIYFHSITSHCYSLLHKILFLINLKILHSLPL